MDKQINEMAKICCYPCEFSDGFDGKCAVGADYKTCAICQDTAQKLYDMGYRDRADIIRRFKRSVKMAIEFNADISSKEHDRLCDEIDDIGRDFMGE